jgi:hypothetical protein
LVSQSDNKTDIAEYILLAAQDANPGVLLLALAGATKTRGLAVNHTNRPCAKLKTLLCHNRRRNTGVEHAASSGG